MKRISLLSLNLHSFGVGNRLPSPYPIEELLLFLVILIPSNTPLSHYSRQDIVVIFNEISSLRFNYLNSSLSFGYDIISSKRRVVGPTIGVVLILYSTSFPAKLYLKVSS